MLTNELLKCLDLPEGIDWYYDAERKVIFPLYAISGGIGAVFVAYLIERGSLGGSTPRQGADLGRPHQGVVDIGNGWRSLCVEFDPWDDEESIERVKDAIRILRPTKAESAT